MKTTREDYQSLYQQSLSDNDAFWAAQAEKYLTFITPFTEVKRAEFKQPFQFEWFLNGTLNVSYNCIDRHLTEHADRTAIIWQNDTLTETRNYSYQDLYTQVNAFSALLRDSNVKAGDVVTIYMPLVPEAIFAMLACARIGAIHSVVFGGFSGEALANRMHDADSKCLITASKAHRGGKTIDFKPLIDTALKQYSGVEKMIIVDKEDTLAKNYPFAVNYESAIRSYQNTTVEPEAFPSEQPLFILYTSGSTGKPKGLLHTSAGYLLYTAMTFDHLFEYEADEVHWCTADIGWITGHSYVVYGPLANAATIYIYEGVPNQPQDQIWRIIEKNNINILYTAPTLIRSLMKETPQLDGFDLSSLRLLGTVGEPINPEAWHWYFKEVGQEKLPVVDTWWQTETGGVLVSPLTDKMSVQKPGFARQPFYGIEPAIIDDNGNPVQEPMVEGALCFKQPWPAQARTVWGNHERFIKTYYSTYPGYYFSGDAACIDKDHEIYIAGRMDDVINVSGHRLSTAEIESALVEQPTVCEAAVIGQVNKLKGQIVYAFVITHHHVETNDALKETLINAVKNKIGSFAKPETLLFVSNLPKTRSGKIMRRLLKKIVHNQVNDLGDTSTLTNPEILDEIITLHQAHSKNIVD